MIVCPLCGWKISPFGQFGKSVVPFLIVSYTRRPMNLLRIPMLAIAAIFFSACTGGVGLQPGDAVVPPELADPTFEVLVLAADDLGPLDADIAADGLSVASEPGDLATLTWLKTPIELTASAVGFEPLSFTVDAFPEDGLIEFRLEPVVLHGRVTSDSGRPLPGVTVALGAARDQTDSEGRYALERATVGAISLNRPAWEPGEFAWDGSAGEFDMSMEPRQIRAIRATPENIADKTEWNELLSLADETAINGLVIDLKTEDGTVVYSSTVNTANRIGAVSVFFNLDDVVADANLHDLYLIGRVGVFQDNFYAASEPTHAVLNEDGTLWRSRNGFAWLDASDPVSFEYSIALGEEACRAGFDEIQFDYVSYPFGGDVSTAVFDADYNQEIRVGSINAFLTRAYAVLNPLGCTVSATLLGIVLESSADEGVGQHPGSMSRIIDVLSPTLYSTNYGSGWKNFENPDDHALEIVTSALRGGSGKLEGYGYFRPWLQTWTISKADQTAVQSAVGKEGMGFMLWSNLSNYAVTDRPEG